MRFSIWPNASQPWLEVQSLAAHAEATGWDGVWFADHFMSNDEERNGPMLECWTVLAGLAASVPRLRLGALVTGNTYRHPAVVANMAATLDHVSGGRAVLGLGAGWQENEHQAYGIELPSVRQRLARFEEACAVVKGLLTERRTDFEGRYYQLSDAPLEPKPVQDRLPLMIGGGGEKVTLRIAARYADEWNVWGRPEVLRHKSAVLDRHCADLGRDPAEIRRSAQALLFMSDDEGWLAERRAEVSGARYPAVVGTVEEVSAVVAEYAEVGVDELIVPDFNLGTGQSRISAYDRFFTEVASRFH